MSTIEVKVPDIGDFTDVPVISVMVKPGDHVAVDDPLVELESDKATMEVPSPAAGDVKEIKVAEGDKVSEGALILLLEAADAKAPVPPPNPKGPQEPEATKPAPAAAAAPATAPAPPRAPAGRGAGPDRRGRLRRRARLALGARLRPPARDRPRPGQAARGARAASCART